ncbi:MAG: molybdate ABC transporter permease subunit [Gammaproteobacteria bacterium]|nr:MAG: molybdate ABC transporter permease subunit [Gammaproteobacteria bacterium]
MISDADISALWLSIQLSTFSTIILMIIGTPLAWWLSKSKFFLKPVIQTLISMPLVLPPTVLGFYLLIFLGQNGPLADITNFMGLGILAFSFSGLLIGSIIYSLPFVVQPIYSSFMANGNHSSDVAATLGASKLDRFFSIEVPMASPGFITAAILGFAHTLGEFGVVLMIGGNIPGKTKVLSIAIYDHVEAVEYASAHSLSAIMLTISFVLLMLVYFFNNKYSHFNYVN